MRIRIKKQFVIYIYKFNVIIYLLGIKLLKVKNIKISRLIIIDSAKKWE